MPEERFRAAADRRLSRGWCSMDDAASHVGLELGDPAPQDAHPGVVISSPSLDEVNELYEIRITLEPLATEIAAGQLKDDELAALERILAQMREANPTRFVELNREFHRRIYPAAQRPRLTEITEALSTSAASYVRMNIDRYDPAYRSDAQAEHEAIFGALRSHAPRWAARAMQIHLEHSARHVAGLIEKTRRATPGGD
jgi:DNA-binding GntR family transcriptional regulator